MTDIPETFFDVWEIKFLSKGSCAGKEERLMEGGTAKKQKVRKSVQEKKKDPEAEAQKRVEIYKRCAGDVYEDEK